MTAKAEKVASGEFPMNHWALIRDQSLTDLGAECDGAVVAYRPKALDMSGEAVLSDYDAESELFTQIAAKAKRPNSHCMTGPEFLVWVASEQCYATLFMGSKSAKREARIVNGYMGKAITLKAKKCSNSSYKWYAPLVVKCSTPFDLPNQDLTNKTLESFNNPPKSEVELAPESNERAR